MKKEHRVRIQWIAESYIRHSLQHHPQIREALIASPKWRPFINNLSFETTVCPPRDLGEFVKGKVLHYVKYFNHSPPRGPGVA